jgi:hypothetical protein
LLHAKHEAGEIEPDVDVMPETYEEARSKFRLTGDREDTQ